MIDYFEDLNGEALDPHFPLEDRESVEKAIELTREIIRAPRRIRSDDVYSALVIWEHVTIYISDSNLGDRIGEIIDLLEGIGSRRKLGPEDVEQGVRALHFISQALDKNDTRVFNEATEGGLESGE